MNPGFGTRLCARLDTGETVAFIGVYDMLSASLAARHFDGVLVSGSAFAASRYGAPDVGFIAWTEVATFVGRLRALLPTKHIVVDIDNGSCDTDVACHAAALMEAAGASGVVLGDQDRRPRATEASANQLLDIAVFQARLARVLNTRRDLLVVARTHATDADDVGHRAAAFADAGANVFLADRASSLSSVTAIRSSAGCRIALNQSAETDSPLFTLGELRQAGVSMAIYAGSCFDVAERAIRDAMESLRASNGLFADVCASMCKGTSPKAVHGRATVANDKSTRAGYPWTAPAHLSAL
jgi:2-methylisocitrate lyase-like PEP mutase family enzyme